MKTLPRVLMLTTEANNQLTELMNWLDNVPETFQVPDALWDSVSEQALAIVKKGVVDQSIDTSVFYLVEMEYSGRLTVTDLFKNQWSIIC